MRKLSPLLWSFWLFVSLAQSAHQDDKDAQASAEAHLSLQRAAEHLILGHSDSTPEEAIMLRHHFEKQEPLPATRQLVEEEEPWLCNFAGLCWMPPAQKTWLGPYEAARLPSCMRLKIEWVNKENEVFLSLPEKTYPLQEIRIPGLHMALHVIPMHERTCFQMSEALMQIWPSWAQASGCRLCLTRVPLHWRERTMPTKEEATDR